VSRTAALLAVQFVKRNMAALKGIFGPPKFDMGAMTVVRDDGTVKGGIDIVLNMPSHICASYFAPAMVIALVQLVWRKPTMRDCSVVPLGGFDKDGRLYGYPPLDYYYATDTHMMGYDRLVLPM